MAGVSVKSRKYLLLKKTVAHSNNLAADRIRLPEFIGITCKNSGKLDFLDLISTAFVPMPIGFWMNY